MAVDMFLKIDGIKGESTDSRHKDWIEIESFSWGATNAGSSGGGSGGGAGKVSMSDLSFMQKVNKATPKLMEACASGKHFSEAVISVRRDKGGGKQGPYLTYKLEDVLISSYQTGASSGDPIPTESISLNFGNTSVSYTGPDGETTGADCVGAGRE